MSVADATALYDARPLTPGCAEALATRRHGLLGVSPFNSWFSVSRLTSLVRWVDATFESWHVFVPDEPARYTLEALGYAPERAAHKARRQANWLHNKVRRAIEQAFPERDPTGQSEARVLGAARFAPDPRYREAAERVRKAYDTDPTFRAACLDASAWALESHTCDTPRTSRALETAAHYFLAEIPFFAETVHIVGVEASVFCYHQTIPFLEHFYSGELSLGPAPGQGFVRLEAAGDVEAATAAAARP
ncbi:MAG: tRNA-dependent cyclodipeptide synthase [Gemmatimonadetes bacterium]|nr:MAG: tRNA-dependent cyclodipeptide synthase [Gemmatimonadota bacterium]